MARRTAFYRRREFRPAAVLAWSFAGAILLGAGLLALPSSAASGRTSVIDALFTSTSAVCVTGLIVQDTATHFSALGQAIILALIQLGGLGIMTFSTMILIVAGRSISFRDRMVIQDGFLATGGRDLQALIRRIFLYTFVIEFVGAVGLFFRFSPGRTAGRAAALAVFHAVSAFSNAGFSLFSDNLMGFRGDPVVNLVVVGLIVLGGLGFLVQSEVLLFFRLAIRRRRPRLRLHTKLVLAVTALLIGVSFVLFLALEGGRTLRPYPAGEKILVSLFQVVTPRTAGYNTIDLAPLGTGAVFLIMFLMFVGASPGSTGGGVKTSTAGVIFAFVRSKLRTEDGVHLFRRSVPLDVIVRAFALIILASGLVFLASLVLVVGQPQLGMREVVFEVLSAFGTVGLSLGLTPELTSFNKLVLVLVMYIGRVGPLTLLLAFSRRRSRGAYAYVDESVMIG